MILKAVAWGLLGSFSLFFIYFSALTLLSGWLFAQNQFVLFWPYIIALGFGFGIQVGLYAYLKNAIHQKDGSGKVLAVSGTTSTAAMISCCAHYLVNILPIIGAVGIISLIGQYQVQFFWIGLAFNIAGIVYIARQVIKFYYT